MDGFASRRSCVYSTHGAVATSQPLATEIGLSILKQGGNAVDACVAAAAALNMTEPCSTGIGGDAFALFYNAETKKVEGLNGSGRCPSALTLDLLRESGIAVGEGEKGLPADHIHTVTVPGAAAAWVDAVETWGKLPLSDVLAPAIAMGEEGFPVHPCAARQWSDGEHKLKRTPNGEEMLIDGRAPTAGELMTNPTLSQTFRELSEKGKEGFYSGRVAQEIVAIVSELGGVLSEEDLAAHTSTFVDPISTNYRGVEVFEIPPNGQGITALIALNILESFDLASMEHNSPEYLHTLIEAVRLAFADSRWYCADPDVVDVPIAELLSKEYAAKRREIIQENTACVDVVKGSPFASSDTVYLCAVDGDGNACSFINSNYMGFGTGIVPKGCGFTLQNRGANFVLDPTHPNCLAPNKRPYHTIIPGLAVRESGELFCPFGVMGGFMQPQGHVQVLCNMIDFGMGPQEALDALRFCIDADGGDIDIEEGLDVEALAAMGHKVRKTVGWDRKVFGRGQIIVRNPENGVLCSGSEPRADGAAMGW